MGVLQRVRRFPADPHHVAIASGGFFGKGTGEESFLKNVGAANTDLVFGVISEQFGLILALCTVFILLVLVLYATRCAATAGPVIMSLRPTLPPPCWSSRPP